jgi:excinuclease UvrABC nuclease subunit
MHKIPKISSLPNNPAIYSIYGGKGQRKFVAYIGIADKLRQRISQVGTTGQ